MIAIPPARFAPNRLAKPLSTAGQGHVHIARNEGTVDLELWATYFDVPAGGAFRINADSTGNCGF
jgi:hypothetical protein